MTSSQSLQFSTTAYVCSTLYHVYITTQKVIVHGGRNVLFLDTSIPNLEELVPRIKDSGLFESINILDRARSIFPNMKHNIPRRVLCKIFVRRLDSAMGQLRFADKVYIYNDSEWIGWYLNDRKIYYHLLEDGLNCFKYFDQYAATMDYRRRLKELTIKLFRVAYALAQSKYCLDVELNDAHNLATEISKPVIELRRSELREEAIRAGIQPLFTIFPIPKAEMMKDGVLILTLPNDVNNKGEVVTEKFLPKRMSQIDFCKRVVELFKGHNCFIKPHPRDTTDYSEVVNSKFIIPREIPAEMFTYVDGLHMYAAVTITSTAITTIDFVEKKYSLSSVIAQADGILPLHL